MAILVNSKVDLDIIFENNVVIQKKQIFYI